MHVGNVWSYSEAWTLYVVHAQGTRLTVYRCAIPTEFSYFSHHFLHSLFLVERTSCTSLVMLRTKSSKGHLHFVLLSLANRCSLCKKPKIKWICYFSFCIFCEGEKKLHLSVHCHMLLSSSSECEVHGKLQTGFNAHTQSIEMRTG